MGGSLIVASMGPEQILTVGDLRAVIEGLPDSLDVRCHIGTDVTITEWDVDEGDGLVLFPDDLAGTSFVSTSWLYKEHPELKAGQ